MRSVIDRTPLAARREAIELVTSYNKKAEPCRTKRPSELGPVDNIVDTWGSPLFLGRTYEAYRVMFNLPKDPRALKGQTIVDVGGGPALFTASLRAAGIEACAVDPCYGQKPEVLRTKALHDAALFRAAIGRPEKEETAPGEPRAWVYKMNDTVDQFLTHFKSDPECYIEGALPNLQNLKNGDRPVDLMLSAHVLFSYAGKPKLSYDMHVASLVEMTERALCVRVKCIRQYPAMGSLCAEVTQLLLKRNINVTITLRDLPSRRDLGFGGAMLEIRRT